MERKRCDKVDCNDFSDLTDASQSKSSKKDEDEVIIFCFAFFHPNAFLFKQLSLTGRRRLRVGGHSADHPPA